MRSDFNFVPGVGADKAATDLMGMLRQSHPAAAALTWQGTKPFLQRGKGLRPVTMISFDLKVEGQHPLTFSWRPGKIGEFPFFVFSLSRYIGGREMLKTENFMLLDIRPGEKPTPIFVTGDKVCAHGTLFLVETRKKQPDIGWLFSICQDGEGNHSAAFCEHATAMAALAGRVFGTSLPGPASISTASLAQPTTRKSPFGNAGGSEIPYTILADGEGGEFDERAF